MSDLEAQRIEEILDATEEVLLELGESFPLLINELLNDTPDRLADIERGLASESGELIMESAHALKGSLGIFELPDLVSFCVGLEDAGKAGDFKTCKTLFFRLQSEMPVVLSALKVIQSELS